MYIEILSVSKNTDKDTLPDQSDKLRAKLGAFGFKLLDIKKTLPQSDLINMAINRSATSDLKPDIIIVANALNTKDSKAFRKYMVESVAAAEKAENRSINMSPKQYWRERNRAFKKAKKEGASQEELEELEERFTLVRNQAKVFNLGDFGNGYEAYTFVYKGVKVAALPQSQLTGEDFEDMAALAALRTSEVYENPENPCPGGFNAQSYLPPKTGFVNQYIPIRGDSPREVGRKLVVIFAFLVFVAALALLFYNMIFLSLKNAQLNGEVQMIAHSASDDDSDQKPDAQTKQGINWDKLKGINKEIVGWIQINDTVIDYPVLWHKGDDMNYQYYLDHNYRGGYDSFGSIFLDYRCTEGTKSKNIIMHGHHMNDGSMFGNLMNYGGTTGNLDFYKKAPTIRFDTPEADGTYKIISVFKTNTLSSHGEFFNYLLGNFENEKDFMNYVYNVRIRSLINCPVDVNEDDELITLSTCSYEFTNFRTVVVARRVRIGESEKVDTSKASLNHNAVWPQVYYSSNGGTRPTVTDFGKAYEAGQIDWYDGDYNSFKDQKVSQDTTAGSSSAAAATTKVTCTVTFINFDGSTISTQQVEYGKAAKAPDISQIKIPEDGYYDYTFKGWQLDYSKVTLNMTIAPDFEAKLKPEFAQAQEAQ